MYLKPIEQQILSALAASGEPMTPKQLDDHVTVTSSYGSIRNEVGPMTERGLLTRLSDARYTTYQLGPAATPELLATIKLDPEVSKSPDVEPPEQDGNEGSGVQKGVQKGAATFGRLEPGVTVGASEGGGDHPAPQVAEQLVQIYQAVDVEAAAAGDEIGFLVDSEDADLEPSGIWLPPSYIREVYGVSPDRVLFMRARGISMRETIFPGDRMTLALLTPFSTLRDGSIYVFYHQGGISTKRLYLEPDHVHVWSDNADSPRYRVPKDVWDRDYSVRAIVLETPRFH